MNTFKELLFVGAGGFIGAIMRFLVSTGVQKFSGISSFPLGTFIVNISGCFIIGLLSGCAEVKDFAPYFKSFIFLGLLGAFTTFSTFGNETFTLLRDQQFLYAVLNAGGQLIVGLGAVWLGYIVAKIIWGG